MHRSILAFESSTSLCSVALYGSAIADQISVDIPKGHHRHVLPMLERLLISHGVELEQIDLIAFGRGPGSFTGLRIGIGIVQGLAYAAQLPVMPISSLQALALKVHQHETGETNSVLCLVDAHMNEVYSALYEFHDSIPVLLGKEQLLKPNNVQFPREMEKVTLAGDAVCRYSSLASRFSRRSQFHKPEAIDIARLAALVPDSLYRSASEAQPLYLRGAEAWKTIEQQKGS